MNWKNLFIFLVITIPSIAILTRLIAWYIAQFKEPSWRLKTGKLLVETAKRRAARLVEEARKWQKQLEEHPELDIEPKVGVPYATYEEYRRDLMGTVDLDEFLARCRAGVPEDPEKAHEVARQKLAEIKKRVMRDSFGDDPHRNPQGEIAAAHPNKAPAFETSLHRALSIPEDKRCHECCGYGGKAPGGTPVDCGVCHGTGIRP